MSQTSLDFTLARRTDPPTSHQAALQVTKTLTERQCAVLQAIAYQGPLSGREAERLARFARWAPSSVRKRITELRRFGFIESAGEETTHGSTPSTRYQATEAGRVALRHKVLLP